MSWLIIGLVIVVWIISQISDAFSSGATQAQKKRELEAERDKYKDREIDASQNLFERNIDIIEKFEQTITSYSGYRSYYIENETRDCINEICLAENRLDLRPAYSYLSNWRSNAPQDWVELSRQIEEIFRARKQNIEELERKINNVRKELEKAKNNHQHPTSIQTVNQKNGNGSLLIESLSLILKPNETTWSDKEKTTQEFDGTVKEFPEFKSNIKYNSIDALNREIRTFNKALISEKAEHLANKSFFQSLLSGYKKSQKEDVVKRLNYIINDIHFPSSIPKIWQVDFDEEQGIVIVEAKLPDVVHNEVLKEVSLKSGTVKKPLNQTEKKQSVPNIHPAIILRIAFEIYRNDTAETVKLLIVNGWVEYDDPNTGILTKTYTASLAVERQQIIGLNLSKIDALSAFTNLKGKSAGKLIDIIPITPVMTLNKSDKRFIETKEVLNQLGSETNLASMDWQDFESLISELFSKEFEKEGAEVKVTQASRDRGVDAVVFDPDPIKGGKFVIQAKRYTNTVDVSAVRDLCAVVKKEGASRGILVTTSTYGADAYAFANNEPVTLLNGAELLGLLKKHGYTFKINLAEAKRINLANSK
jgi:HJR/Mrr/RecB family endonuclease